MSDIEKVTEFLKNCNTYYLATVDEEGNPHVRPFGTAHIFEGHLYFQTGLRKQVAKQLLANGKVEISGMYKGEWIRLAGHVTYDPRPEAQSSLLEAYPSLKKMYAVNDGNTAVFYFDKAEGEIDSFAHAPEKFSF